MHDHTAERSFLDRMVSGECFRCPSLPIGYCEHHSACILGQMPELSGTDFAITVCVDLGETCCREHCSELLVSDLVVGIKVYGMQQ